MSMQRTKKYPERTWSSHGNKNCLFLTYKMNQVCKISISRWILSRVIFVYEQNSETLSSIRSHGTRRVATSWALFNGATAEEILQIPHWATSTTSTAFHIRSVCQVFSPRHFKMGNRERTEIEYTCYGESNLYFYDLCK